MIATLTSKYPPQSVRVWTLWFVACLLAGCETWINFAALPGLNWVLTTLGTAAALVAFSRLGSRVRRSWRVPLMLACATAGGAAVTADSSMDILIFVATLGAFSTAILLMKRETPEGQEVGELLLSPAIAGLRIIAEAKRRGGEALGSARAETNLPVMRGIALAAPVTVVFALLLSNADPLLASWRDTLVKALEDLSFFSRAACFALFGVLSLGSLGLSLSGAQGGVEQRGKADARNFVLGDTERLIVLVAVASLFGLFLLLQVSHFFGNTAAVRGNGITYAQMVHQGFGELTIVASLCSALLIVLARSTASGRLQTLERTLSFTIIAQTQLLLVSAFHRMALYEAAYGFTELRLLVQVYIAVVCVALLALAVELNGQLDCTRLFRRAAVIVLLAVIGLGYWNHAGWIARANLARFERSGTLDVTYVAVSLGKDAVPDLIDYLPRLPLPLQTRLRSCLHGMYQPSPLSGHAWYEWSYRRTQLEEALRQDYAQGGPVAGSLQEQRAACYR